MRVNVRATTEFVFEEEPALFLGRLCYGRGDCSAQCYCHGHRDRRTSGTFGTETVPVPCARIEDDAGTVTQWRSKTLLGRKGTDVRHRKRAVREALNAFLDAGGELSIIAFADIPEIFGRQYGQKRRDYARYVG